MWLLWKECCSVVKATRNWRYVHICVWVSAKEVLIDISSSTSNYLGKGVVWQTQCACVCSLMYTAAYSTCVCLCLHACVCKRCCHCVCREVWQGTQGQLEIKSHLTVVCWNALWGKKVSWSPPPSSRHSTCLTSAAPALLSSCRYASNYPVSCSLGCGF